MSFNILQISKQQTYPLRNKVLRPNQPLESCYFPEDDWQEVFHLAASQNNSIIAIASFYPQPQISLEAQKPFRLRGMACDPDCQGNGVGSQLLQAGMEQCRSRGSDLLWFNARSNALQFYKRLDFAIKGEEFEIEGIGPHFLMYQFL